MIIIIIKGYIIYHVKVIDRFRKQRTSCKHLRGLTVEASHFYEYYRYILQDTENYKESRYNLLCVPVCALQHIQIPSDNIPPLVLNTVLP